VDSLQEANARDYCTLFFRLVESVETIGDVNWEEKPSASYFDLKVRHNFGETFADVPSEIKHTRG
jgi:hypothetical protein